MSDVMLDYGEPIEGSYDEGRERDDKERAVEEMDAEMQDWADHYEGDLDQFDDQREKKMQELRTARAGTKFYSLPREESISAGANRGVVSQSDHIDDAELQGPEEEAKQPDIPSPIGGGQDVRYAVLHLAGSPVTQCSTSRLFAYLTHYGAQPLGLEWVNDSSCNVVFSDSSSARLAIEYLCPAVSTSCAPLVPLPNDQILDEAVTKKKYLDSPDEQSAGMDINNEWDSTFLQSLLYPRKAHRIPARLYNAPERDAAAELRRDASNGQSSTLPEDVPEIYREMEAEDRQRKMMKPEQMNLQKLRGTLWLRWALESLDVKPSRAAKQSKWYQEHGNDAGKEVVTKILDVGRSDERLELLPSGSSSLPSRPEHTNGESNSRGRGGRRAAMDDLDADLDAWRDRDGEELTYNVDEKQKYRQPQRHRNDRRGRMTLDALDEELEASNRRDRSSSPARLRSDFHHSSNGSNSARVKGRGRTKAPSAWDDDDGGGMQGDLFSNGGRRGRGQQHARQTGNSSLEQRLSQSLEQRINGGRDLLDRMS